MSEWLQRVLSDWNGNPSTKRHIIATSAAVLCFVSTCLGLSCAVWVWKHGDLGAGAVGALTFALGILAGLAGNAYRKPDGVSAPPAREPGDCVGLSPSTGAKEPSPGGRKCSESLTSGPSATAVASATATPARSVGTGGLS